VNGSQRARVAVTGLGLATALGHDAKAMFRRLAAGERAFSEISEFDVSWCKLRLAAEIKDFRISDIAPAGMASLYSRADALAVAAAQQAASQAGVQHHDLFLSVGGTSAGMREAEPILMANANDGARASRAQRLMAYPLSSSAGRIAGVIPTVRHSATFCSACSSSATAIAQAALWVASGRCDCAMAGGTDALSLLTVTGFAALGAMAPEACRPFDQDRCGMSLGEGAAFLVLESEAHALGRGAEILAWLDGWSLGAEAHHITHPEPSGNVAARLIASAIRHAGLQAGDIGYYNAHGTGTVPNDSMEAAAVRIAFGNFVDRVFVSTAKGQLGHTLGASGAIEAAVTILALREARLPPTMGLRVPARDTRLNHVVGEARSVDCRHAVSSSFGFGGLGAVLAFSHVDTPNRIFQRAKRHLTITGLSGSQPAADPLSKLSPDRSRRFDRITALSCAGAEQVLTDRSDCGLVVGYGLGNVARLHSYLLRLSAKGVRGIAPAEFPHLVPSAIAGNASIYLGLTGPVTAVSDPCYGCDVALDFACGLVQMDLAQAMVAGVVESSECGTEFIADPLGVLSNVVPAAEDASFWVRVEAEDPMRGGGQTPLARVVDVSVGQQPWYQYFIDHEAPLQLSRFRLLFNGIDVAAFGRLQNIGRWVDAPCIDVASPGQSAAGRSGAAIAAAVRLIADGGADEVVLISRAATGCLILRLDKP
jgi:3-oxoacyl-[acyl-carrier-protein] synthase II